MSVLIYGLKKELDIWVLILGNIEKVSSKPGYFRLQSHGVGKYGRVLGAIYIQDKDGNTINVNTTLISEGHAYEYFGGKKVTFSG